MNGSDLAFNAFQTPKVLIFLPLIIYSLMDLPDAPAIPPVKDTSKTIKTKVPISKDDTGCPTLPSIDRSSNLHTKVVQAVLRDYCTAHARELYSIYYPIGLNGIIRLPYWQPAPNHFLGSSHARSNFMDQGRMHSRRV